MLSGVCPEPTGHSGCAAPPPRSRGVSHSGGALTPSHPTRSHTCPHAPTGLCLGAEGPLMGSLPPPRGEAALSLGRGLLGPLRVGSGGSRVPRPCYGSLTPGAGPVWKSVWRFEGGCFRLGVPRPLSPLAGCGGLWELRSPPTPPGTAHMTRREKDVGASTRRCFPGGRDPGGLPPPLGCCVDF